ncbi:tol-pal system protein YbgF [Roseospira visakhapatnamensis]|uniref:Cell division coordinator CpoB n=1 Tax=Roseospira visakhapatnamensis TaxID=390880 RepID=A0A7W6WAL0_9PROT|nr:tol-pal system protein YbgF [Roseospira visakhapatnamensis]MBB4267290.1 tol-pal system protein YbgF [Roseospira visakhapatnamensis]
MHAITHILSGLPGRAGAGSRRLPVLGLTLALGLGAAMLPPRAALAQQDLRPLVADLQVRITQMEEMVRGLTGQLEQSEFRTRQLEQRLDLLSRDMDLRLRELEGTGGDASATPTPTPGSAAAPAPTAPPAAPALAPGAGVLGYLPTPQAEDGLGGGLARPPSGAAPTTSVVLPSGSPEEQYSHAFLLLRQGDYGRAEQAFAAFIQVNPSHSLAGNAQYWLGETHYARGDYENAAVAFAKGFKDYSSGSKAPDNLFKLGMSMSALGKKREACAAFQKLRADYPDVAAALRRQVDDQMSRNGC